ncbi:Armadillo-type fold [Pseudocohnilembus persalinus]|uniref:Coatomer subunit beta n=1 Tax=Pseudocohnilembus persalinus TaxID=266149 RepID=A0A0V0QF28_PSEPJ|nr:Armadillo-type fold [Pseudocohnilembus persalinus]|eukprot:KRX00780.1 Armadillo-type fold [Pseudocohnilembus persalinus]
MSEKYCSIYLRQEGTFMNSQQIEKQLKEGTVSEKIKALKQLIMNIINDDTFPRSVWTVINTLVPLQTETHDVKKILLYYWEIIEKVNPDGSLKDEMLLVCNSIRKDLLHPNEWIRGRTLRLVSRIMNRGVLEPLLSVINENLEHTHVYVRRNAVVALNRIYLHFGDDLVGEVDEQMEKILINETDLSTKRNAFQLLFHANQAKALEYLNNQISNEAADEMGDIFQLSVLELFRKACKFDPSQKPRLLKVVFQFAKSNNSSVLLECANTLVQISTSNTTLKLASQIYLQILNQVSDNNVKMALNLITEQLLTNQKLNDENSTSVKEILCIIAQNNPEQRQNLVQRIIERFYDIQNQQIYKGALWIIGEHAQGELIIQALDQIKESIGSLPLVLQKQPEQNEKSSTEQQVEKKVKVKTVILPDGSYGQKIIEENDIAAHEQGDNIESKFRQFILTNSILASSLARTTMKLLYRIRNGTKVFNKYSAQTLLIFCALLRFYAANISKVDQDAIEKLNLGIRLITSPQVFKTCKLEWLVKGIEYKHPLFNQESEQNSSGNLNQNGQNKLIIAKQVDDVIAIRSLKGKAVIGEIDLDDEEQNEGENILGANAEDSQDFVHKLGTLVQLTGLSDPIYAEAFVNIHKFDIQFEVFLVNRTNKMLQNISVEFNTQGELKMLDKAPSVTLQPNASSMVKTSIKFSSQDIGLIFGNINYENMAGQEQNYLVTKEINIDLIDFIVPKDLNINRFRQMWAKYEWENRITLNTNIQNLRELVEHFEEKIKIQLLGSKQDLEVSQYLCANFYAQTKLDDDFLVNLSAEIKNNKIEGYIRIRAKNKGIVVNLGEKIKQLQNKQEQ